MQGENENKANFGNSVPEYQAETSVQEHSYNGSPLCGGARGIAIRVLTQADRSDSHLDKLLDKELNCPELTAQDKSLLTELVNGVTRWQSRLDWVLTGFYHGEFVKCIPPVKNAMRVALYQILFLDKIPAFAAVNESVEIIKRLKGARSANLVNAVLRNIIVRMYEIRYPLREEDIARYFAVYYSHPQWMIKRWLSFFGEEHTEKMLIANNSRPHISIRIHSQRTCTTDTQAYLASIDARCEISPYYAHNFAVYNGLAPIAYDAFFTDGKFTIQDSSATLAAALATPQTGNTVLDMCSAPGGKTTFYAEYVGTTGKVVALDRFDAKLRYVEEAAKRMYLDNIITHTADAAHYQPDEQFDIVTVDAPCTGHGTLAKKPDIKWKRDPNDIIIMSSLQKRILKNAAKCVKPGGILVYSTCTVEPEENIMVAEWFSAKFPEFELEPAENFLPSEVCLNGYMQTFPGVHQCDGAFAARWRKRE